MINKSENWGKTFIQPILPQFSEFFGKKNCKKHLTLI